MRLSLLQVLSGGFAALIASTGCAAKEPEPIGQTKLAATFPSATLWVPTPQLGSGFSDPPGDGKVNGREVIGSSAFPAVYTYLGATDFFVRLRVDVDPRQGGDLSAFGWGVLFDTNNNSSAFEFSLLIDAKKAGNAYRILLAENTSPTNTGDPSEPAETERFSVPIDMAPGGNVVVTQAEAASQFSGNPDFYIDFAFPRSELLKYISLNTPIRLIAGSSSSANALTDDLAGTPNSPGAGTLDDAQSDLVFLDGRKADADGDGIVSGADLDEDNDGIPDTLENASGINPDGDADSDGVPNYLDKNNQGNGTASTCTDANADNVCDAPSSLFDADGDGTPNHQDLDSDNDAIADRAEAGHRGADANSDGMVDGPYGANGLANSLETGNETGTVNYVRLDTDADGTRDFLDTDSDGDGARDIVEAGRAALDANADGRIDSPIDLDDDGLMDVADADPAKYGFPAVNVTAAALDSDSDGIPNPYDPASAGPGPGDSDSDGLTDSAECTGGWVCPDGDADGIPNYMEQQADTDNDGVPTGVDTNPTNPNVCKDSDGDSCDDCAITGANGSGGDVRNDGPDNDGDDLCDAGDPDDDNDGVCDQASAGTGCVAGPDPSPNNPNVCRDTDSDTCDDCALSSTNGGNPANDGTDTDSDGMCNAGDPDDDNDGVCDGAMAATGCVAGPDTAPTNPNRCRDSDGDTCDDCAVVHTNGGDPANDGTDTDADGSCNAGDPDDDNDGVCDGASSGAGCVAGPDTAPTNPNLCRDSDADTCDDCAIVHTNGGNPANDGTDTDADGKCDAGDPDDDNDGVCDTAAPATGCTGGPDSEPTDPNVCADSDDDTCDDCANAGAADPNNDGADGDRDGICDAGEDADGDGTPDAADLDADNDGIRDRDENLIGLDPDADADNDGIANYADASDRGDGTAAECADVDTNGVCDAISAVFDADGDGVPNHLDLDSDDDGIADAQEAGHVGADSARDGVLDGPFGSNGLADDVETSADSGTSNYVLENTDGDTLPNFLDADSDGDGEFDVAETGNGSLDANADGRIDSGDDDDNDGLRASVDLDEGTFGQVGTDVVDFDTDSDTIPDPYDADDEGTGPGDSNGDGLSDADQCPNPPGWPGCPDLDDDGQPDYAESSDEDGDGVRDSVDLDDDQDGIPDKVENVLGIEPLGDNDADGLANFRDANDQGNGAASDCTDADQNGTCDALSVLFDADADGIPNHLDLDADGDNIYDANEAGHAGTDSDGNGRIEGAVGANGIVDALETNADSGVINYTPAKSDADELPDFLDADSDGDLIADIEESGDTDPSTPAVDTDQDGTPDYRDADSDGDTISDRDEAFDADLATGAADTDQDGTPDYRDADSDGDGLSDSDEAGDADESTPPRDTDQDGTPDYRDTDSDGDGVTDDQDNCVLVANPNQADADGDGKGDACDDASANDSDGDGIPDANDNCPTTANPDQADSDADGTGDACESPTTGSDADGDGIGDATDNCPNVSNPNQADSDADGTGDACDDADSDGLIDANDNCPDAANQTQTDSDNDGLGDACDRDKNGDGFDDELGLQGGGCSLATRSSSGFGGVAALFLAALAMAVARRRRRRAVLAAAAVGSVTLASATALAQEQVSTEFPVERSRLSVDRNGILDVESANVPGHLSVDAGLWLGYAKSPLNTYRVSDGERVGSLVSDRYGGGLVGALSLFDWFQFGVAIPLVLAQDQDAGPGAPTRSLSNFGLGNVELRPKLQFLRQDQAGLDVAIIPAVTLPTTTSDDYFGDKGVGFAPELAVSRAFGAGIHGALNVGYRLREGTTALDLNVDDELFSHIGIGYRGKDVDAAPLRVDLTLAVATSAEDPFRNFNSDYAETKLGIGYEVADVFIPFAAGGVGVAEGFGTPDFRVVIGARLAIGGEEKEPPPPPPAPPPPKDTDGDGLLDPDDKCPREPEVRNEYQDDDGCPDELPDTDGDGLVDMKDQCPEEPEDRDSFQDENGCPDPDNDADKILDVDDKCPNEPGVPEMKGCPDPDRDKDTVVDRLDNCPDEPGKPELKGCNQKQLVQITGEKLEILDIVHFQYNKALIQARSFTLLDNVASVIKSHPEIKKIRVEGHTDDRGNDEYNKRLSQARAESVVRYLVDRGVPADRLEAVGYGEEKPLADNKDEKGRSQNRRVEFTIVQ